MGGDEIASEKPVHKVTLTGFYIAKYPVTKQIWKSVMGANSSRFKRNDNPVENISWLNAHKFIKKLNLQTGLKFRLPSEAEWEYAAKGGLKSKGYKYAGSNTINEVAWYSKNAKGKTHAVGQKKANELGLYDMSGNVWEWCEDDGHDNYIGAPDNEKAWIDTPERAASRVIRGGSSFYAAAYCRSLYRDWYTPGYRLGNIGFRLVLSAV